MKHNYDKIPGWRRPMDKEHEQILEAWRGEVCSGMWVNAGKMKEIIAIGLFVIGLVCVILFWAKLYIGISVIIAGLCLFCRAKYEKWRQGRKRDFLMDIVDKHYKVISANTTRIMITGSGRRRRGYAEVWIPGKFESKKLYRVPFRQARYYVEYDINSIPILFVRMRAYDTPFIVIAGEYV